MQTATNKKPAKPATMLYDNPSLNKTTPKDLAAIAEVKLVPVDLIDTPEQIRTEFDQESIEELAKDIDARGLLQPVLLNPIGDRFQLIAGERRLRAVKLNGATGIPALLVKASADEALLMQLAENIQRENLNLEEECKAIAKLYDMLGSLDKVAETVKKSKPWCSKRYAMTQKGLHYIAQTLLENGITEDIELLKSLSSLINLVGWSDGQAWSNKITEGKAGRDEVRAALKTAKNKDKKEKEATREAVKARIEKVSHAKPKEPPPPPPWKIDYAMYDLSQALGYIHSHIGGEELLKTWTEEQQREVERKLEDACNRGRDEDSFKIISSLIMNGLYDTPYIDIEMAAMVWGHGGRLFELMPFLAQLQTPREKA